MFYDVTRALTEDILIFPGGDPTPVFRQEDHGEYLLSLLSLSTHTGTHIDAPSHYLKNDQSIDLVDPASLIGRCRVLDLGEQTAITRADLEGQVEEADRLLFRTWFSGETAFDPEFPHLTLDAASFLVEQGISCVGIDSPSIEAYDGDGSVHRTLLRNEVAIIELLDLSGVPEGDYYMAALPLRLKGLDGSPARVILSDQPIS
ncbi:cyclase family protein [Methanofollis formosanus]|uniref:Cyclase family protein n=1 Tax=Methanofollis formosanus TaxID=299308 RepID=A0A8G1EFY9_9EURY|nr:cyclase family protein [Methanofollis formosanus]QYZ79230.1 cyclase family protein [Methanofollis formosanus]